MSPKRLLHPTRHPWLAGFMLALVASGSWSIHYIQGIAQSAENAAERAQDNARDLAAFTAAEKIESCQRALRVRGENKDLLIAIVYNRGGDQELVDLIEDAHANLPTPADCD